METIVKITWDKPQIQEWLCADNIKIALSSYCKNTKFDVKDINIIPQEQYYCNTCKHMNKYEYGGRVYCEKQTNKSCLHGFKRVRRTNHACHLYEKFVKQ